jgi:hypothetical protein
MAIGRPAKRVPPILHNHESVGVGQGDIPVTVDLFDSSNKQLIWRGLLERYIVRQAGEEREKN